MTKRQTVQLNGAPGGHARLDLDRAVILNQALGDQPPTEWRLLRAGPNDTVKGVFHFTRQSARMVMDLARAWGNEYSADYEHASVAWPPTEAPAAAWYDLELRESADGPELWANRIRWTTRAAERIKAKEYRYISPVLHFQHAGDDAGTLEVTEFVNFALTNLPATKHMDALIAASKHGTLSHTGEIGNGTKGATMKYEALLVALGLNPEANEQAALRALRDLEARAELAKEVLGLIPEASEPIGTITAWRDAAGQVETLTTRITELEGTIAEHEDAGRAERVEALLAKGLKDGKLTPASRDALTKAMADTEGRIDPERLESYLNAAPRVVPGATRQPTGSDKPAGAEAAGAGTDDGGKTAWERLSNTEKVALKQTDPTEFARLYSEHTAVRYGN